MPNLFEIGQVILEKNNFEYCVCIFAVWEKGVTLHLNELEFPSPSLAEIEKYEKLTDAGDSVTINKLFFSVFVYSYRMPKRVYSFWYLNYRYWSIIGFTRNILYSFLIVIKYPYILSFSSGGQ